MLATRVLITRYTRECVTLPVSCILTTDVNDGIVHVQAVRPASLPQGIVNAIRPPYSNSVCEDELHNPEG